MRGIVPVRFIPSFSSFLLLTTPFPVCQIGCTSCAASTGVCTTCASGFTPDANDKTKCDPPPSTTSSGTLCPPGAFAEGANCTPCSSACSTCTGGTAADCVTCAAGTYLLNGTCVGTDANGVCTSSGTEGLIANNDKGECDTCGAKCTSCKIPNFTSISTVNELQCTGCVSGFVLSNGTCVASCPAGTFAPTSNSTSTPTCTPCDSACGTCAGSASFCLTCAASSITPLAVASTGQCVATCPANTFSTSTSCLSCHADCATCTGALFTQCATCPPNRPVLQDGRCLPTCAKNAFFDPTSSSCIACDASCSSCSGAGPSQCLACASNEEVLRSGTCVAAACTRNSTVVAGLGVCLSELVAVSSTSSSAGIDTPTAVSSPRRTPLAWWEILLMALGCAFIFLVIVWAWRRRARKQRAKGTERFAQRRQLDHAGWRWRLLRFGEKLFGHRASHAPSHSRKNMSISNPLRNAAYEYGDDEGDAVQMAKMRAAEEARDARDMDKLLASYEYPRVQHYHHHYQHVLPQRDNTTTHGRGHADSSSLSTTSTLSAPSLYSQVTGKPPRIPEPKEPLKSSKSATTRARMEDISAPSRFSTSTIDEYYLTPTPAPPTTNSRTKNPFWK
ncbi:insulin-like growth factor binding protein [Mycena galopus ATCC 62051]|nr:insulin-like growth factor binding protein [Mycena galopus ATCC 62051]